MGGEAREVEIRERGLTLLALGAVLLLSTAFFAGVHVGRGLVAEPGAARAMGSPGAPLARETPEASSPPEAVPPDAVPKHPSGLPPGFQGPPRPAASAGGTASALGGAFRIEVLGRGARAASRDQQQRLAD